MYKKLLALVIAITVFVGSGYYVWQGGEIREVSISGLEKSDIATSASTQLCIQKIKGQSFYQIAVSKLQEQIKNCDKMIEFVKIETAFPYKITVTLDYFLPLAKVIFSDQCELITRRSLQTLSIERCLLYKVPTIKGIIEIRGSPILQYLELLTLNLQENNIQATEIEYKGDFVASWVIIKFAENKEAYIAISSDVKSKVTTLKDAISGLSDAKENYTSIDLRFDRVVYK